MFNTRWQLKDGKWCTSWNKVFLRCFIYTYLCTISVLQITIRYSNQSWCEVDHRNCN